MIYKNSLKKVNYKKIVTLFLAIIIFLGSFLMTNKDAYAEKYEMPNYIRVGLINNFANKKRLTIYNEKITIGYNSDDFTEDAYFKCNNGFYFENNDSVRYISSKTYDDYEELLQKIDGSNDYIPVFIGENEFKIATKAGRGSLELANEKWEDYESIVLISGDNKELAVFDKKNPPLIMDDSKNEVPLMKLSTNRSYRGFIQIVNGASGLTAVNHVFLDEYLYGVVTSEMPHSWHIEALKAQALTARTFAFKRILSNRYTYYDVVDTVSDQVYGGYNNETESGIKASTETSREVIIYVGDDKKYNGKLIDAYFSSCNGGVTEESQNVWMTALPYLKSKEDPYEEKNKYYGWTSSFNISDLQNAMKLKGENVGTVTGCTVTLAKESGRVLTFNVIGSKGTFSVSKDSIRSFFTNYMPDKINSTNFELYTNSTPQYTETEEERKVSMLSESMTEKDMLKGKYILGKDMRRSTKIKKDMYVINGEETVSELNLITTVKTEKIELKLEKGEYMIVGNGYGHGVGMSQYGAKGMAEKGFTYDEIINFYYTDVDILYVD